MIRTFNQAPQPEHVWRSDGRKLNEIILRCIERYLLLSVFMVYFMTLSVSEDM
jgi:hypothetical protein